MPTIRSANWGGLNFWADSRTYNMVGMTPHKWLLALVDQVAADRETRA